MEKPEHRFTVMSWIRWLQEVVTMHLIPTGARVKWGVTPIPAGWLSCDGSAVSRTRMSDLFRVIGTTFGAGDGSTTFNLPNDAGFIIKT